MPSVERPDGATIAWREQGSGHAVVLLRFGQAPPSAVQGLTDELATDHRVIEYDTRGTGDSTRTGPYEIPVDADDLIAVLENANAGPAVAVAFGDGANRAVRAAAERGDLISTVITSGQVPFGTIAEAGADDERPDAMGLSDSVFEGLMQLYESDFRAGLHSVISSADPTVGHDEIRARVEATAGYADSEVMTTRLRSWRADDALEHARSLGDRLWIQAYEGNPWFPIELLEIIRDELPEARIDQVEDGPINRPDLAAEAVRELTGTCCKGDL